MKPTQTFKAGKSCMSSLPIAGNSTQRPEPESNEDYNCQVCDRPDADEGMVQCDKCDLWSHYSCVGEDSTVADRDWICTKCKQIVSVTEPLTSITPKVLPIPSRVSVTSRGSSARRLQIELQKLEEERQLKEKSDLEEFELRRKRDQEYVTKKYELINMMADDASSSDNEKDETNTSQVRTQEWVKVVAEAAAPVNLPITAQHVQTSKANSTRAAANVGNRQQHSQPPAIAMEQQHHTNLQHSRPSDFLLQKHSQQPQLHSYILPQMPPPFAQSTVSYQCNQPNEQQQSFQVPPVQHMPPTEHMRPLNSNTFADTVHHLTRNHMAARQLVCRELQCFSGNPDEWPLFISNFERTTELCGFSNEENLFRLQKALKGKALESVRSMLIQPNCVPQVISTLKMLFGRPELIIHTLLQKLHATPSPKTDRLETIVNFAVAVQNLCATMNAAGLVSHLSNPTLLQELVDKLPPTIRLNWAIYKQTQVICTISHFSSWLYNLAEAANCIIVPTTSVQAADISLTGRHNKEKGFLNYHSVEANINNNKPDLEEQKCCVCDGQCSAVDRCKQFTQLSHSMKWAVVKENKLCRRCLKKHTYYKCESGAICGKNNCTFKHHKLLHNDLKDVKAVEHKANDTYPLSPSGCNTHHTTSQPVLFRIIPVTLYGNEKQITAFAFLDEGSSLTLMDEAVARELGMRGTAEPLCLSWTSNTHRNENESEVMSLKISGLGLQNKIYDLKDVHTVKGLQLSPQTLDYNNLKSKYNHLKGLPIGSYNNESPRLLIGLNNWTLGLPLKCKEGKADEPVAVKTRLGWTVHGCYAGASQSSESFHQHHSFHACDCQHFNDSELHTLVKQYVCNENLGVSQPDKMLMPEDETRALKLLAEFTIRKNDRYETGLLWRYDDIQLPDSFPMARRRFGCLQKRLARDPRLAESFQNKIQDYVSKGYARKLTSEEITKCNKHCWYLPIFPVYNPNKPGKLRIVWDAAAKVHGVSLNSVLLKGPDQLIPLTSVLFKFREKRIALCADIMEMFHQIRIREKDQHFQRFLWSNEKCIDPQVYVMTVMTFGATCSPSCAQYIKNKNADGFVNEYPRAVRAIHENHYVDDLMDSVDTEHEAIQLANDIRFIHNHGGFFIRNWISNSSSVLKALHSIPTEKISLNVETELGTEKVLGMWWCTSSDNFIFKVSSNPRNADILFGKRRPTKREVLKILMTIFDPLGLLANFLMYIKVLLQDVWRSGIGWDEELKDEQYAKWIKWLRHLPEVEKLRIPRCYINTKLGSQTKLELHLFVDASENGYAAVAYVRSSDADLIKVALIGAKTRVAPLKSLSIPRLELQAATLGARLSKHITESHSITFSRKFFWSDSKTVLCWLRSDHRRYKQYVAFRVSEILEVSDASEWCWIPTKQNVADEGTKWNKTQEFSTNGRWLRGPEFLYLTQEHSEYKQPQSGPLCKRELQLAENKLIKEAQESLYVEEITCLLKNRTVNKSSPIFKLCPHLDEHGLIRASGRIEFSKDANESFKRPVVLPRHHRTTYLIIMHFHVQYKHQNYETVLNEIRQRFYIPRMRAVVSAARRSCQYCKNYKARPQPPIMAPLPPARLSTYCRPFSFVGIDYFGPISITNLRRTEKRWGVLLTCLTTRAIHIEVAHSLSTDSCIMAIRNFISRRGTPIELHSDNGTNFRGAERELKEAVKNLDGVKLMETFTSTSTKWIFIPPGSPHMGGSWERLVRSIKAVLYQIMPTRNPSDELLRSMLLEVEHIINSRPLTYLPLSDEHEESLTPNHFLLGSSNGSKPLTTLSDDKLVLKSNWLTSQQYADRFWKRWVAEYLPTITRRSKWFTPVKPIEVGDIVIIVDPNSPRNCWPKGKIISVKTSKDNQVRSASVLTPTGIYERPVVKLAVLDVSVADEVKPTCSVHTGGSVSNTDLDRCTIPDI